MMRDFSPGSPPSWSDFLTWKQQTFRNVYGDRDVATGNTFKTAQGIKFHRLNLESISLPEASASIIYDEYKRREKAKNKEDAEDEEGSEEKTKDEVNDDFWGEEDTSAESSENDSNDEYDFWGEGEPSTEVSVNSSNDDDFWGEGETSGAVASKSSAVNDKFDYWESTVELDKKVTTNSQNHNQDNKQNGFESRPWKIELRSEGKDRTGNYRFSNALELSLMFEIDKIRTRVVDLDGNVLIPWTDKFITSFKNGVARVLKHKESKKYECPENSGAVFRTRGVAFISFFEYGLINSNDQWIDTPEIVVQAFSGGCKSRRNTRITSEAFRQARKQFPDTFDGENPVYGYKNWTAFGYINNSLGSRVSHSISSSSPF